MKKNTQDSIKDGEKVTLRNTCAQLTENDRRNCGPWLALRRTSFGSATTSRRFGTQPWTSGWPRSGRQRSALSRGTRASVMYSQNVSGCNVETHRRRDGCRDGKRTGWRASEPSAPVGRPIAVAACRRPAAEVRAIRAVPGPGPLDDASGCAGRRSAFDRRPWHRPIRLDRKPVRWCWAGVVKFPPPKKNQINGPIDFTQRSKEILLCSRVPDGEPSQIRHHGTVPGTGRGCCWNWGRSSRRRTPGRRRRGRRSPPVVAFLFYSFFRKKTRGIRRCDRGGTAMICFQRGCLRFFLLFL